MATPALRDVMTETELIPSIHSEVFVGHEDAQFAVGVIAVGNEVVTGLEDEYQGYLLLRGNVYAHEKNYMPVEDLQPDGTETDEDDARSVHFAVIENAMDDPRVVGAMRLIIKSREEPEPLPIERIYPEAFTEGPATIDSTEASRLIGRHESNKAQRGIKWLLFAAAVSYINEHDLGPAYGVVPPALARALRIEGMPVTNLADPKFVPEINSTKLPIRIDLQGLTQKIEGDQPGVMDEVVANNFVYSGTAQRPAVTAGATVTPITAA